MVATWPSACVPCTGGALPGQLLGTGVQLPANEHGQHEAGADHRL